MKTMRKTVIRLLAALLGLCLVGTAALAEQTAVINTKGKPDWPFGLYRVALRKSDTTNSDMLFRYYSGTEVQVLSKAANGFAKVRIGSMEGFMMDKYLSYGDEAKQISIGSHYGQVDLPKQEAVLTIYERPTSESPAVATAENSRYLTILGVGDIWHHVRLYEGGEGFVLSRYLTETDTLRKGVLKSKKNSRIALYDAPDKDAKSLGKYYPGVELVFLFSPHTEEGWRKVRIGNTVGYVNGDNVSGISGETVLASSVPEKKVQTKSGSLPLRTGTSTTSTTLAEYANGTKVRELGTIGDWSHVLVDGYDGYMQTKFLK